MSSMSKQYMTQRLCLHTCIRALSAASRQIYIFYIALGTILNNVKSITKFKKGFEIKKNNKKLNKIFILIVK